MQPLFLEIPNEAPSVKTKKTLAVHAARKPAEPVSEADALRSLDPAAPAPAAPLTAPAPSGAVRRSAEPAADKKDSPEASKKVESVKEAPAAVAATPAAKTEAPPEEDSRRSVHPQIIAPAEPGPQSQVKPVMTRLATLIHDYETGIAGHPHDDKLFTLFWYRSPSWPEMTFAVALQPDALKAALAAQQAVDAPEATCLVLLDHQAKPAAKWPRDVAFHPSSWASPLVAREVGPVLPRWEASVFLLDPAVFNNAASAARWRLGIIVTTASLAAIGGAVFILRDARRAAREARLKTDFVSNVSHELKTPLTSIRMFSDLLGNNPDVPPEKTKRYAEVIAGEAARLTRLINNVLNFSRMESGKQQLKTTPLDLRALTAETMEHMRPQLEKEGFEIEVVLPEKEVTVLGDGDALSQVLLNLLSNAGKYGTAPDLPRSITVSLTTDNGHAILSVADRGPGIPRGQERRVFEKFQRAHDTLASGTAGSGLGLTIARRLAEAHRGTLDYAARAGGGAEFIVTLGAAG
jgi:signal transduction histidine kinase